MAKKHLPIQFFEKRKDYDDRSTEGGGNSAPPSWVLTGDALTAKSSALTSNMLAPRVFQDELQSAPYHAGCDGTVLLHR